MENGLFGEEIEADNRQVLKNIDGP